MANALARLFWHLRQTPRHFWIPLFCEPSPKLKAFFPNPWKTQEAAQGTSHAEAMRKWPGALQAWDGGAEEASRLQEGARMWRGRPRPASPCAYCMSTSLLSSSEDTQTTAGSQANEAQVTYEEIHYKF